MTKRRREVEAKVAVVDGRDAGREGPFVMYYASGFDPVKHEKEFKLSAYRKGKTSQMELIGETVGEQ
eukprot:70007-Prorocentrum_minimum.AAC.5